MQSSGRLSVRKSRKRRVIFLVITAVVLILAGWWWSEWPKEYRLVGRYPIPDMSDEPVPTSAGFLLYEGQHVFVMRDWTTGLVRWRVTTPEDDRSGWPGASPAVSDFGISPDGHTSCFATLAGPRIRLLFWRDGKSLNDLLLPLPETVRNAKPGTVPIIYPELILCDGERSYLQLMIRLSNAEPVRYYLFALEGNRLVGKDVVANAAEFSPDGQTISFIHSKKRTFTRGKRTITKTDEWNTIARVSIEKDRLTYQDKYVLPTTVDLAANGTAVAGGLYQENSTLYHIDGSHDLLRAWEYIGLSDSGRHTLFINAEGNKIRVISFDTNHEWIKLISGHAYLEGCPTDDGQGFLILNNNSLEDSRLITCRTFAQQPTAGMPGWRSCSVR